MPGKNTGKIAPMEDARYGGRRGGLRLVAGLLAACAVGVLTAAVAAPARKSEKAPQAVTPIIWTDLDGRGYGPLQLRAAPASVFIFFSTECPVSAAYMQRVRELEDAYYARGVKVFLVNAHPSDTLDDMRKYAAERKLVVPMVKDSAGELADRLGVRVTPEVAVVGREGQILYRGRIDDNQKAEQVSRRDLAEALDAALAGKPVGTERTPAQGSPIVRSRPVSSGGKQAVTYSRDIAPILHRSCADCHRPGEVAPFSLLTYQDARQWARMIQDVTQRRIMPPWKPLAGYGDFHDGRALTAAELDLLTKWVEAGTPQGNPKEAPKPPVFSSEWPLGKPDFEIRPDTEYDVAAEGRDEYRCFVLPVEFRQDAYIKSMQVRPGNRAVVHHVIVYIDYSGTRSLELDAKDPRVGFESPSAGAGPPVPGAMLLAGWAPGNRARPAPAGMAMKVPKGARLVMEVHYHKSGRAEKDRTTIGMTMARDNVDQVPLPGIVVQPFFQIPAGAPRAEVKAAGVFLRGRIQTELQEDMTVHGVAPHMHQTGREMKVWATLPDGKRIDLIWLSDWDFNWQESYQYREPIKLPRGTKVELVAYYDNSVSNPRNPNRPPKPLSWGEQTTDEMCVAFLTLTRDAERLGVKPASPAETVSITTTQP